MNVLPVPEPTLGNLGTCLIFHVLGTPAMLIYFVDALGASAGLSSTPVNLRFMFVSFLTHFSPFLQHLILCTGRARGVQFLTAR